MIANKQELYANHVKTTRCNKIFQDVNDDRIKTIEAGKTKPDNKPIAED